MIETEVVSEVWDMNCTFTRFVTRNLFLGYACCSMTNEMLLAKLWESFFFCNIGNHIYCTSTLYKVDMYSQCYYSAYCKCYGIPECTRN